MKVSALPFLFFLLTPASWPLLHIDMFAGRTPVFPLPFSTAHLLSHSDFDPKKLQKKYFDFSQEQHPR